MTLLDKINHNIRKLPTLPTIFSAISDAMNDPRVTNDEIAKIISSDQASSFKVLQVANSAFYGFRNRIDTISQAIMVLGFNEVRNIVLALSVINMFKKEKEIVNFNPVDFWAHSIGVGIITRMIGKECGLTNLENYFVSGILHDIGKLFFYIFAGKEYSETLKIVDEKNCSVSEAEHEVFGFDHASIGSSVAERWHLSPNVIYAIKYHQSGPNSEKYNKLIASVHVANIFARVLELGNSGDNSIPIPNLKVWEILNFPPDAFNRMYKLIISDFEQTVSLLLSD
jgi:HD-like signal output (HDOD) protein